MLKLLFQISFLLVAVSAANECRGTDVFFQNQCFNYNAVLASFDAAERFCEKNGMHLAKIINAFQNHRVAADSGDEFDHTFDSFWIGGSDRALTTDWRWTDGSKFVYANWQYRPNSDVHCTSMLISTGQWIGVSCDKTLEFVCQYAANLNPSDSPYTCPPCNCRNKFLY